MILENQSILIISNEPWGDIWFSKQNWAYELSQKNKVFFINPPERWSFKNLFLKGIKCSSYSDNLTIINYNNRLPLTRFEFIFLINEFIISKSLNGWLTKKGIKKPIFWSFDPYRFSRPQLFNPVRSIFFRVDIFLLKKRELRLIKNVDGLIVTAKELLKGTHAKKELVLSHGISQDEFKPTSEIKYEPGFILYVGQIDRRVDLDLLEKMLIEFPNERFLFIGNVINEGNKKFEKIFCENRYKNLILHGVEHFKNLKNYVYHSKACLVPMDLKVHGNAVHHHKSLQYLAMGKPIISPIFNDVINNDKHILGYKNYEEAIDRIKHLESSETKEKIENRINFARQFLYSNLITKVEKFLD